MYLKDYIPDFRLISEYIWISGYSVFSGFKSTSISEKEYRFLVNNMLFQLDSESIFEMMDDYPQFILGTSIRGEGKMACPVLFNIIKLEDIRGIRREHIKEFIKQKMNLSKLKNQFINKASLGEPEEAKEKQIQLKGSLKFVMKYIERYKKIKILEEEGVKGVKKIQLFLENDSIMVVSRRGGQRFYLINEMKRLEKTLLKKRDQMVSSIVHVY